MKGEKNTRANNHTDLHEIIKQTMNTAPANVKKQTPLLEIKQENGTCNCKSASEKLVP